jgi:hypothetical protein
VEGGGLSQLFDLDAQPLTEAFAVPEGICGFALSPDRTTVATSSYWGMPSGGGFFTNVRLFDTLGVPITSFRWDRALIGRLWFSEDGLRLFGQCDKTGSVLVGPGGWRAAIALACDRLKNHPALREAGNRESQGASETCRAALASGH